MTYTVELKTVAAQPLAVVRRVATHDQFSVVVPQACGEVWSALKKNGVHGAGRLVAVYLDGVCNLEIGTEIGEEFADIDQLIRSDTPAGLVVTTTHYGPYPLLKDAHEAVRNSIVERGLAATGLSWEIYGHWDDNPSKLRTDVFYLVTRP